MEKTSFDVVGSEAAATAAPVSFLQTAIASKMPYPYYGYAMYVGVQQARMLGIKKVTVIEFGVAGGNGLVAMESHAAAIEEELGIVIDVVGFDTGIGMPPCVDEKDMPHLFVEGNYAMNEEKLRSVLSRAKLVLGNAVEMFPRFLDELQAPIAAISFDLDHYHSTLSILNELAARRNIGVLSIPRLMTYFDNSVGNHLKAYNEYAGELRAINDFNAAHQNKKITMCRDFLRFRYNREWYHQIYFMHFFDHPKYNTTIIKHRPTSLSLKV
ncbi:MAG: hypothetical protein V5B36_16100 [Candidatus Accumulibacter sp. UW25]|jgi:hypothetical protein